jgi:hypothetical protein
MMLSLTSRIAPSCTRRGLIGGPSSRRAITTTADEIDQANQRYEGKIVIKETAGKGWGLYSLRDFEKDSLVLQSTAIAFYTKPGQHTVQIDYKEHVDIDLPGRLINHICGEANVGIRPNNLGAYDFLALRYIEKSEELVWDYEASEFEISTGFACQCSSSNCRGQVKGFRYNGGQVIQAYGERFVAPFLLENQHGQQEKDSQQGKQEAMLQ